MIGAYMASDRRPFVGIESDGSLMMNLQEMQTIASHKIPLRLFVFNNNGYASIRNTQRNYFEARYVGTGPEAGLWMPDLKELARTYQLPFLRIGDAAELAPSLAQAMARPRPMIVEVLLQRDEALAPKVAAVPQADGSMTSMPLEDMSPLLPLAQLQAEMRGPLSPASLAARGVENHQK